MAYAIVAAINGMTHAVLARFYYHDYESTHDLDLGVVARRHAVQAQNCINTSAEMVGTEATAEVAQPTGGEPS